MDLEDLFPSTPGDPLVELAKQDLDPIQSRSSEARIAALEGGSGRVETHVGRARTHRSAADELFKKS